MAVLKFYNPHGQILLMVVNLLSIYSMYYKGYQKWSQTNILTNILITKFPLAPMGVLVPVSARAQHSAQPPINN